MGLKLLLVSLYQPLSRTLGRDVDERSAASIRPQSLGEVIARRVAEESDERRRAARIPQLGTIADETSHKVARQYEANPYPRWTGLGMLVREGDYRRRLGEFFAPDALGFMNGSFDVLIAGCGTGRQAIQAALGYGPQARVLALDLSSASLAYASRMADKLGVRNIDFVRADIQHVDSCQDFPSRFHVIECAGVLHHMADPFQGWRTLLKCLRRGGLMVVGLYSASGRANLTALRNDPLYPGAGCDEAQLRSFRQALMARPDGEAGSELKRSADFYSASGFRDLTLHVSEQCLSLPQIELFLDQNGLVFRGFHPSDIFAALRERFPAEVWPGALSRWAELEAANPFMFSRMYQFWCQKL
jgi:SAM-dependent methyltransferase